MSKFYTIYQELFGEINCTYSIHVILTHLLLIRGDDPLTKSSAFPFENFYGDMRHCFVPGTTSTTKQIFKKMLMKSILSHHVCENPITITCHETPKECNNLIYTFISNKVTIYKVIDIQQEERTFTCQIHGKYPCTFENAPLLDWGAVGVFLKGGVLEENVQINMDDVAGKVLIVDKYLITCPNNVLREK